MGIILIEVTAEEALVAMKELEAQKKDELVKELVIDTIIESTSMENLKILKSKVERQIYAKEKFYFDQMGINIFDEFTAECIALTDSYLAFIDDFGRKDHGGEE